MTGLLERLGVALPVVQAGMGGGLARHELAAAVSDAGGLGTIGILAPEELRADLAAARALTAKPIAINLCCRSRAGPTSRWPPRPTCS